ncbi:MAG: TlpA disulfide reductase family protein [Actinomycetota bacterium]|nr:TlpA disulfide reductase family protein [Actinomycetota bacterium]
MEPLPRSGLRLTAIFVGVVLAGLAVGWAVQSPEEATVAQVGEMAPDFTVPIIGAGEFSLSEQLATEDKPIVLNLWASWCPPCRAETPEISAFAAAHPEVKVIGVAVEDTESAAAEFAAEFAPAYDLAFGDPAFEAAYPRLGLPVTYVISADGKVANLLNGLVNQQILEDLVAGLS